MKKTKENQQNRLFLIFNWKLKKAYETIFQKASEEFKLTQNEIDILLFLKNNTSLNTARDIARYRAMSKSMISKSVDSLYKRGYLSYKIDESDKRCIRLKINPIASRIVQSLSKIQKTFFITITKDITEDEYKAMQRVLNKMHENINNEFNY